MLQIDNGSKLHPASQIPLTQSFLPRFIIFPKTTTDFVLIDSTSKGIGFRKFGLGNNLVSKKTESFLAQKEKVKK